MAQIVTGFHAIEEKVRRALDSGKIDGLSLQLAKTGPRIKKNSRKRKKSRNSGYKYRQKCSRLAGKIFAGSCA